jgi:hypothetical protein
MTKIVINRCYGGFGLSPKAEAEYLKRKGKQVFFYKENYERNIWIKVTNPDQLTMFYHVFTIDLGESVPNDIKYSAKDYFSCYSIPRDDPDLVAVVEELGEESWGACAKLSVVEIPDDVDWEIDEYDGMECISEKHQTWS